MKTQIPYMLHVYACNLFSCLFSPSILWHYFVWILSKENMKTCSWVFKVPQRFCFHLWKEKKHSHFHQLLFWGITWCGHGKFRNLKYISMCLKLSETEDLKDTQTSNCPPYKREWQTEGSGPEGISTSARGMEQYRIWLGPLCNAWWNFNTQQAE